MSTSVFFYHTDRGSSLKAEEASVNGVGCQCVSRAAVKLQQKGSENHFLLPHALFVQTLLLRGPKAENNVVLKGEKTRRGQILSLRLLQI